VSPHPFDPEEPPVSRFALLLAAACVLGCAGTAAARPKVGGLTPDSLPFGTLHTGSLAEGSFMLFAPADDPNPPLKFDLPKFVKVLHTDVRVREFGKGNKYTCLTIEVALDTSDAGELKGEIVVTAGETKAKVPVSATVKARKPGAPRVLFLGSPFHAQSTDEGSFFKGWTDVVDATGLDASYALVRHEKSTVRDIDLSKFDTVLVSAEALVYQNEEDVKRVRAFAEKGGRVVLTANAFFVGSVKGANAILDGYGLEMKDVEERGLGKEVAVKKDHFDADLVKAGIEKAKFFRASPVKADKGKGGRILVGTPEFDQTDFGYIGTTKAGKGEVVAMGESLWWAWVGERWGKDTDNGKVLGYLLAPPK
jgi:hypothetical protein